MKFFNKRGLSPIIATLLLISITFALAIIIFFWARSFIEENIQKQGQPIQNLCGEISFQAEIYETSSGMTLFIENNGDVHIHGVEIKIEKFIGEIIREAVLEDESVPPGRTREINVEDIGLVDGNKVILTPILQGETNSERKAYVCDEKYGIEVIVG